MEPCGNCGLYFLDPPAAVVTPTSTSSAVGLSGRYCSWNCAKRRLIGLRNRPWFALMAITALKSGAKLPLRPSESGKPPHRKYKEVVKVIPNVSVYSLQPPLFCPTPPSQTVMEVASSSPEEEPEPVVFESVSMVHSSFSM